MLYPQIPTLNKCFCPSAIGSPTVYLPTAQSALMRMPEEIIAVSHHTKSSLSALINAVGRPTAASRLFVYLPQ
jgi:hypothetical protein